MTIPVTTLFDRLAAAEMVRERHGGFDRDLFIDHLAHDSREVRPGSLFVAIRGAKADGHQFIDKAVRNGAIAIVCEAVPAELQKRLAGIALACVDDARAALGELSACFYGDPSHALTLVGVTGTNGKTTTASLVHQMLSAVGHRTGLVGTIAVRIGQEHLAPTLTTPDAITLNKLLRQMVDAGCSACVMEVSSHALHQERVHALAFDVGVFTNLTRDHLDYHRTFDAYRDAKKKLFDDLAAGTNAIYNADDPNGAAIVRHTRADVTSFGTSSEADIRFEVLHNDLHGLTLHLDGSERRFRLVGRFNAYNVAAAYGVGKVLGVDTGRLLDVLEALPPVPGRFEQRVFAGGTTVVVDYAHTPDALKNVLETIHETKPATAAVWCVFGCGGERDTEKRPMMGAIAERYADHVIVTSDNPRTEDPLAIMEDIRGGMERPDKALFISDRRAAIFDTAERAQPGDVVLVAGKGHERQQDVAGHKIPFDDREETARAFGSP